MLENSVRIGVVITTYNSPEWLEKVFWGYANQSDENFELIIADDGSTEETRALIINIRKSYPFRFIIYGTRMMGLERPSS
jgi:glycosyltransferase involved in cell wall biosynthesis